jgi:hypothetical protein
VTTSGTDESKEREQQPARADATEAPQPAEPSRPAEAESAPQPQREEPGLVPEPVFTPFSLTVGDGFKFGCGFTMALVIAALIGLLALSLVLLVASLVGAPIPFGR